MLAQAGTPALPCCVRCEFPAWDSRPQLFCLVGLLRAVSRELKPADVLENQVASFDLFGGQGLEPAHAESFHAIRGNNAAVDDRAPQRFRADLAALGQTPDQRPHETVAGIAAARDH